MKKSIIILSVGVAAVSLIWLVNEMFLAKMSAPKPDDKQQKAESAQQGSSPTEQKTTAKPTSKPPVYDLSQKAHWYNPETTFGINESRLLSEMLKPFQPSHLEFQIIAQYETSFKNLAKSLSEDEHFSVEGRTWLRKETDKLNGQILKDLGVERHRFYIEVIELSTGYYDTWKVLNVNGISEERVQEFRELADQFNQRMHGRPLFRADRYVARSMPREGFRINSDERERLAKVFRDRIEQDFGKQVLNDVLSLGGSTFFMDDLEMGVDTMRHINLIQNPLQRERLERLYDFKFVSEDEIQEQMEEDKRLEERERKLVEEWIEHYGTPTEPEEASSDSP